MIRANELRKKYLSFFEKPPRNHQIIPSSPLVPENDPTTLFTSSGMQPLISFILGEKHPLGSRLVNSQLCFRGQDIDEVGNSRHTTFFEMLGNWSLGDYFKKEQLSWFFEFLTKKVGLNPVKLYVSVFEGSQQIPKDEESIKVWQELFKTKKEVREGKKGFDPKIKIYTYDVTKNWWSRSGPPDDMPVGEPGGATSEVFYDFGPDLRLHKNSPFSQQACHINCDCGRFVEIGNSVFMEYRKNKKGTLKPLPQKNVDFGGGFERILAASVNQPDIFKTELFWPIVSKIEKESDQKYPQNKALMQVIADHLKAATFMIDQGIEPDNKQQGYILRRLLRRAAVKMHQLKGELTPIPAFQEICYEVIRIYQGVYFKNPAQTREKIKSAIEQEMEKFGSCLDRGLKKLGQATIKELNTLLAFDLFQTYGFPLEVTEELFKQKGKKINKKEFQEIFKAHQKLSRTAAKGMFKGGLADSSEKVTKLHTVTHLLHQALRDVLGDHVQQTGSNITAERLRFDFTHPEKLTEKQLQKVEKIINQKITQALPVRMEIMTPAQAKKRGALAFFAPKYGQKVKVYSIGDYSQEICGGPHLQNTSKIGHVKIKKEESVGTGKRRIYAVLTS